VAGTLRSAGAVGSTQWQTWEAARQGPDLDPGGPRGWDDSLLPAHVLV